MKGQDPQTEMMLRRTGSSSATKSRPISVQSGRPLPPGPGSIDKNAKSRSSVGPVKAIHTVTVVATPVARRKLESASSFDSSKMAGDHQVRSAARNSAQRAQHVRSSSVCAMQGRTKSESLEVSAGKSRTRQSQMIRGESGTRMNGDHRLNNCASRSSSSSSESNPAAVLDAKNNNRNIALGKFQHSASRLRQLEIGDSEKYSAHRRASLGSEEAKYSIPNTYNQSSSSGNNHNVSSRNGRASVMDRYKSNGCSDGRDDSSYDADDDEIISGGMKHVSVSNGSSVRVKELSGNSASKSSKGSDSISLSNGKSYNNNKDIDTMIGRRSNGRDREGNSVETHARNHYNDRSQIIVMRSSNLRQILGGRNSGTVGLNNLGNTCFMNSILQCLSNTVPLLEYCLSGDYRNDINKSISKMKGAMITESRNGRKTIKTFTYAMLMEDMWLSNSYGAVAPSNFKSQISRFSRRFVGYSEQDAHELLVYLLEGLHEDINRVKEKRQRRLDCSNEVETISSSEKASLSWKEYLQCENSQIIDIFGGQLKSALTCVKCGYVSNTFEPFLELSLPIKRSSSMLNSEVSLKDCFEVFTQEEMLSGDDRPTCARCRSRQKCSKRFFIQRFPHILIIHLKRFNQGIHIRTKLKTEVNCPMLGLDLDRFASEEVRGRGPAVYNLYAVSNHSGTPMSGHYTAHAKHPISNMWHYFNDSRVTPESLSKVSSSDAYLLFYERQA